MKFIRCIQFSATFKRWRTKLVNVLPVEITELLK